jgi:SAM-dependent methyltransferase
LLNWLLRYQPVARLLDDAGAGTVLDVGSGWHGLSAYRPGLCVQTDLDFDAEARGTGPRPGRALYVAASAEALPFRDAAFDYAVSLDMFEHLPADLRATSVQELCRVARRGVLVGFPVGGTAKGADDALHAAVRLTRRPVPPWLAEHRAQSGYPDRSMLVAALPAGWRIAKERPCGNVVAHTTVLLAEMLPFAHLGAERLERRWSARDGGVPAWMDRGRTYRTIFELLPDREGRAEAG